MENQMKMHSLDDLTSEDLLGKTIFVRVDFNVPLVSTDKGYRVADDTRIRRFIDLTFKKIHDLTDGNFRMIIGSHLGRPHKKKDHKEEIAKQNHIKARIVPFCLFLVSRDKPYNHI